MARKKQHITYDSKETHTIVGLLSFLFGLFFLVTLFTNSEAQTNLFSQVKNLFGNSTALTAIFLITTGLHFLGAKWSFTKTRSLLGQFALVFLIPAVMTAFSNSPRELARIAGNDTLGGEVGYLIVNTVLGDVIPTQPATKFILIALTLIALPVALSLSLSELFDTLVKIISWISGLFKSKESEEDNSSIPEKASTFGDFNKFRKQTAPSKQIEEKSHEKPEEMTSFKKIRTAESEVANQIKEGKLGDDGLRQDTLKYPNWVLPNLSLLIPYKKGISKEPAIEQNAKIIEQTLESFDILAKVEESYIGPSIIQYALNIGMGINVNRITNLSANLALALGVDSKAIRIDSIPETSYLGIEIPRTKRDMVRIKELMESSEMMATKAELPVPIGKDIDGSAVIADIKKMPHLLIAGATGSGKSVLTNSFITSLLLRRTPDEVKFILVDPKQVELSDYNGIPHLLTPVITDMDQVVNALKWAVGEMDRRYTNLAHEQVRNIEGYNQKKGFAAMPYIVIVIDEMADMMMTANRVEAENAIVRLAQKARAVGIHLILATQRPSVNVITGIIKANIPGRVAMSVTSSTDSRVILDRIGAESLMGRGDLLYKAPDSPKSKRLQGTNIEQDEVIRIVDFIKSQAPEVEYMTEIVEKHVLPGEQADGIIAGVSEDNMFEQSVRIVVQSGKGSSSYLQRRLNIGFNRAARLLEELEEAGVVGPANGSKPREVLITDADAFLQSLRGGSITE